MVGNVHDTALALSKCYVADDGSGNLPALPLILTLVPGGLHRYPDRRQSLYRYSWDENRLDSLNIIGSSTSDLVESGSAMI